MASSTVPATRVHPLPRLVATARQAQQTRPRAAAMTPTTIAPAIVSWLCMMAVWLAARPSSRIAVYLVAARCAALASRGYRPSAWRLSTRLSAVTTKPTYMSLMAMSTLAGTSAAIGFLRPGAYCDSASCWCPGNEPPEFEPPGYDPPCPGYDPPWPAYAPPWPGYDPPCPAYAPPCPAYVDGCPGYAAGVASPGCPNTACPYVPCPADGGADGWAGGACGMAYEPAGDEGGVAEG